MSTVLTDKTIKQLIQKIQKQVARQPKKDTPTYDATLSRSEPADNQEELDAQFAFAKRREF